MRERPGGAAGERKERERGEEEEREREERGERLMPAQRLFFPALGGQPARASFLSSSLSNGEIRRNRSCLSLSPTHTQVLSEHFPGVELAHDIRSLQSLPEVKKKERKRERRREEKGPAAAGCGGGGGKTHSLREKKNRHQIPPPKGIDLVVAGFPCVDVSRAGLRAGLDGRASGLVRVVFETPFSSRFFFSLLVAG